MAISVRRMMLEEFLNLPEVKPALELVSERVVEKVSRKAVHVKLQMQLGSFVEPRKLAAAFTETRVTFAGNSVVPDVVVYRWHRIQCDANGEIVDDFTTPPDISIEIVSPGQSVQGQHECCR